MCFGGGKPPSVPAPPPPSPIPTASEPTDVASQTVQQRANVVKQAQYGLLSTIKTGGAGLTGSGPDLAVATATAGDQKKTLGGS